MTHAVYLVQIILSVLAVHISHSNAYYQDIWIEVINSKLIRMITCDKIEDFVALVTVVDAKCYANYDNRLDKQTLFRSATIWARKRIQLLSPFSMTSMRITVFSLCYDRMLNSKTSHNKSMHICTKHLGYKGCLHLRVKCDILHIYHEHIRYKLLERIVKVVYQT